MENAAAAPASADPGKVASFSRALRYALIIPAIAWSLAALLATFFFEPRSVGQTLASAVMLLSVLVELLVVPVAIWRLTTNASARTPGNVAITTLGAMCLLPAIALYLYVLLG
jgi:hypothetical protein